MPARDHTSSVLFVISLAVFAFATLCTIPAILYPGFKFIGWAAAWWLAGFVFLCGAAFTTSKE